MRRASCLQERRLPLIVALGVSWAGIGVSAEGSSAQEARGLLPQFESVFRVQTRYGDGTGFLVHGSGLVLTNAHVTRGQRLVEVKLDDHYKVAGHTVHEDEQSDVALIRVHPDAVAGRTALGLSQDALDAVNLGDLVQVVGYPFHVGKTLTRGVLSRKTGRILLTDAAVSPGNSGGPIFDASARVIGMASFFVGQLGGAGLGGGITAGHVLESLGTDWLDLGADSVPSADSLPVLPLDEFPIEDLMAARSTDEWPLDLYDISGAAPDRYRNYDVRFFTPPVQAFVDVQRAGQATTSTGQVLLFADDLRHWSMELGGFSPVVIVRITPKVSQSPGAFWANLILGGLAGATNTYLRPIDDPSYRGTVSDVLVQVDTLFVRPIELRFAWSVTDGEAAQVAYLVMDPHALCDATTQRQWTIHVIDEVMIPFPVPSRTLSQVCSDFDGYLRSR